MWSRRYLLALAPPLLIIGALVHELAHALAVVAQGGRVREVQVIPSVRAGNLVFGRLVHDGVAAERLVWIAPTLLWTAIAAATLLLVPRVRRPRLAEGLIFALALFPMVDVSFGFAGLFFAHAASDLHRVFHGHETAAGLLMNLIFAAVGVFGWSRYRAAAPGGLSAGQFASLYLVLLSGPWVLYAIAG